MKIALVLLIVHILFYWVTKEQDALACQIEHIRINLLLNGLGINTVGAFFITLDNVAIVIVDDVIDNDLIEKAIATYESNSQGRLLRIYNKGEQEAIKIIDKVKTITEREMKNEN